MERALQLWGHLQILVDCYDDIDGGDFMRQCADFVGLWGWSTDWSPQSDPSYIKSSGANDVDIYDGGGDEKIISNQGLRVSP